LIDRNDKICVAASGGKDSTAALYLIKKYFEKYDLPLENIFALVIDEGIKLHRNESLVNLKNFCKKEEIKLKIVNVQDEFSTTLDQSAEKIRKLGKKPCTICGIWRRYIMNKQARLEKATKLITGHNLDDEAQAFLMNVFRNDFFLDKKQGPKSENSSKKFIPRVKPLYLITEEESLKFSKSMKFPVKYGICPCSVGAHRRKHKTILDNLEEKNPGVKYSVIRFQEEMKNKFKKREKNKNEINNKKIIF